MRVEAPELAQSVAIVVLAIVAAGITSLLWLERAAMIGPSVDLRADPARASAMDQGHGSRIGRAQLGRFELPSDPDSCVAKSVEWATPAIASAQREPFADLRGVLAPRESDRGGGR